MESKQAETAFVSSLVSFIVVMIVLGDFPHALLVAGAVLFLVAYA